jgi:hypothetical protein
VLGGVGAGSLSPPVLGEGRHDNLQRHSGLHD